MPSEGRPCKLAWGVRDLPQRPQRHRLRGERRASVALLTALAAPAALGVIALGIDASDWELTRVQLQRIADIAAMAGASQYAESFNAATAASTAATSAELNGVPAGTQSGTDTVTITSGGWSTSIAVSTAVSGSVVGTVTATVQESAPVWLGGGLTTASTQTIAASAVAQVTQAGGGGQACLLALKGDSDAITTNDDISISGNTSISSANCDVRSDGSLTLSGNASTNVPKVIASGTITTSGGASISCSTAPCSEAGVAQIPDPFYSTYYSDLTLPSSLPSGTQSGNSYSAGEYSSLSFSGGTTATLQPGTYYLTGSLSLSGSSNVTLGAGVYYVSGSIKVSGGASITGKGVTLISNGGISISGGGSVNLTAPSSGSTAGLLFGSSSSSGISFSGGSNLALSGAVYAPNAPVTITGNSGVLGSASTCLDVVASTATFSGNSDFSNSGCAALGVPAINDAPATAALTQ